MYTPKRKVKKPIVESDMKQPVSDMRNVHRSLTPSPAAKKRTEKLKDSAQERKSKILQEKKKQMDDMMAKSFLINVTTPQHISTVADRNFSRVNALKKQVNNNVKKKQTRTTTLSFLKALSPSDKDF